MPSRAFTMLAGEKENQKRWALPLPVTVGENDCDLLIRGLSLSHPKTFRLVIRKFPTFHVLCVANVIAQKELFLISIVDEFAMKLFETFLDCSPLGVLLPDFDVTTTTRN